MLPSLFLTIVLLWKYSDQRWQANWVEPWMILIVGFSVAQVVRSRLGFWSKVFLVYFVAVAALGSITQTPKELSPLLKNSSIEQLLLVWVFLGSQPHLGLFSKPLKWVAWIVAIGTIFSSDRTLYVTFLQNPSMAATFVVLASGVSPYSGLIALICHSWTASACFVAGTLFQWRHTLLARLGAGFCLLWVGFKAYTGTPFNGRLEIWKNYLSFWVSRGWGDIFFGMGPGTTRVWLPYVSFLHHQGNTVDTFIWAHSDWIQLLIEMGGVGWVLGVFAFTEIYKKSDQKPVLIAYAVAMSSNMPLHWPLLALVGWSLLANEIV